MHSRFFRLLGDCRAVTAVEYALISALICLVCISALTGLGAVLDALMNAMETAMSPQT